MVNPDWDYDYIFCACGTATTYSGIVFGKKADQKVIGISVLKGNNTLNHEAETIMQRLPGNKKVKIAGNEVLEKEILEDDCIINAYAFNGLAKLDLNLVKFKNEFESATRSLLTMCIPRN